MDNRNRRPSFTRHCIFCGEPPVKKNKEHVIPLWLIRLTGDPNRQIHISVATDDPDHLVRKFAFDQFTFPSCTRCNSEFETLEGAVKPIIIAMLDGEALDSDHIALIMDWFDKVRIGLWLAYRYLDGNFLAVTPKFYIKDRVALRDRALVISRSGDETRGLRFAGANTPAFRYGPSCFALMINDIAFLNMSAEFLCARRLGFPHVIEKPIALKQHASTRLVEGTERTRHPVIRLPFDRNGLGIYQACFVEGRMQAPEYYSTKYVQENSLTETESLPFVELREQVVPWEKADVAARVPMRDVEGKVLWSEVVRDTLRLQIRLADYEYSHDHLSLIDRRHWREMVSFFRAFADTALRDLDV